MRIARCSCVHVTSDLVFIRYVAGNVQNEKGDDLINEAGGGVIVVTLDHRLGVFGAYTWYCCTLTPFDGSHMPGFLAGSQVKEKGALNTGLREFVTFCMRHHT